MNTVPPLSQQWWYWPLTVGRVMGDDRSPGLDHVVQHVMTIQGTTESDAETKKMLQTLIIILGNCWLQLVLLPPCGRKSSTAALSVRNCSSSNSHLSLAPKGSHSPQILFRCLTLYMELTRLLPKKLRFPYISFPQASQRLWWDTHVGNKPA